MTCGRVLRWRPSHQDNPLRLGRPNSNHLHDGSPWVPLDGEQALAGGQRRQRELAGKDGAFTGQLARLQEEELALGSEELDK
jgi:hypothetical protein